MLVVENKKSSGIRRLHEKGNEDKVSIKTSMWFPGYLSSPFLLILGEEARESNVSPTYTVFVKFPVYSLQAYVLLCLQSGKVQSLIKGQ